jgi:hypothetical protein
MDAHKTLDEFVETSDCQDALHDLLPEIVAENVERIKPLLRDAQAELLHRMIRSFPPVLCRLNPHSVFVLV